MPKMTETKFKTTTWAKLKEHHFTSKKLAKFMGINTTYDTYLPQEWLNNFIAESGLPFGKVIYSSFLVYTKGNNFGTVYSAWDTCQQALTSRKKRLKRINSRRKSILKKIK